MLEMSRVLYTQPEVCPFPKHPRNMTTESSLQVDDTSDAKKNRQTRKDMVGIIHISLLAYNYLSVLTQIPSQWIHRYEYANDLSAVLHLQLTLSLLLSSTVTLFLYLILG